MGAMDTPRANREVLEVLRTGEKRPIVDRSENRYGKSYSATIAAGRTMYRTLVKIGEQYGLAKEEFDAFLTIPSPRFGEKVFYPFHVLSRSQAQKNRWDWNTVKSLSRFLARTMAKYCNKWARAAGLHEEHAAEAMTYFLAAYYCERFARIKRDRPTASKEEVLWYTLDRWGLPTVPWAHHPFKLSLAKGPDRGVAMMLGLQVPNLDEFDPLKHIDVSQRTVEVDAWLTNSAMYKFNTADWDSIRTLLCRVPLHHSFWRVDARLGDSIWNGSQMSSLRPVPPSPAFTMPLLPIDDWVNGASDQGVLRQQCFCGEHFSSIGLLLRHCQERHPYFESPTPRDAINPNQDVVDKTHWDSFFFSDDSVADFKSARGLERHGLDKHPKAPAPEASVQGPVSPVEKKPFRCEPCDMSFVRERFLREHLVATHGRHDGLPCTQCDEIFAMEDFLMAHIRKVHGDPKPFKYQECPATFAQRWSLNDHIAAVHRNEKAYKYPHCDKAYGQKRSVVSHVKEKKAWRGREIQVRYLPG